MKKPTKPKEVKGWHYICCLMCGNSTGGIVSHGGVKIFKETMLKKCSYCQNGKAYVCYECYVK